MSESSHRDDRLNVALELDDLCVRLSFALPSGWSPSRLSPSVDGRERDGRLALRMIASSTKDDGVLRVAASRVPLPLGLAPAVVYWSQLLGLEEVPEDPSTWADWPAFSGLWRDASAGFVAVAWIQVDDVVVELHLEGLRATLDTVWAMLRASFRCESFREPLVTPSIAESWTSRVARLRHEGQIEEAIAVIEREGDCGEALLLEAQLHAERMRGALAAAQTQAARNAWQQAVRWARAYAASATSGGEGAARSFECERFLKHLGSEPGSQ